MNAEIRNAKGERLDYSFHDAPGGNSSVVVIGHGVTANKDRPFVEALAMGMATVGVSALRFSFAGNGASEGSFEECCITKEVGDLGAVLDALPGKQVIYVGHSMGGAVGVIRAARDERIRGLVSLAGMVHTAEFANREFGDVTPGAGSMWDKPECPLSQAFVDDMNEIGSVTEYAPHITVPWLLVHGGSDDVVPIDESREIHALANEPKELFEIPECDHVFDAFECPDALPAMVSKATSWVMPLALAPASGT